MTREAEIQRWIGRVHAGASDQERLIVMHPAVNPDTGGEILQSGKPQMTHKAFTTNRDAARYLARVTSGYTTREGAVRTPRDVWVALASFSGTSPRRRQAFAAHLRAVWLDLDVDPGNPAKYQTQEEAVRALIPALPAAKYPPPTFIVSSGNGIHVYWTTDAPMAPVEWRARAYTLRAMMIAQGLRLDGGGSVTVDICRVLRPAGTFNYKDPTAPKAVSILQDTGTDYPISALPVDPKAELHIAATPAATNGSSLRGEISGLAGQSAPAGASALPLGNEFSGGVEEPEYRKVFLEPIAPQCRILNSVLQTEGRDCDEPQWRAILQLCSFAEDSTQMAHAMSKGHLTYDPGATEAKLTAIGQQQAASGFGPMSCGRLASFFITAGKPHPCEGCRFRDRVKGPLSITKFRKELPIAALVNVFDPPGLLCVEQDSDGKPKLFRLLPSTMEDVHLVENFTDDARPYSALAWTAVGVGNVPRRVHLELTSMADARSLNGALARQGVSMPSNPTASGKLMEKLQELRDTLRTKQQAERPVTCMGWQDHATTPEFFYGRHMLTRYGKSPVPVVIAGAEEIQAAYTPRGSLSDWRRVASNILLDGRNESHAVMASAFASPLIRYTEQRGLNLCLMSPNTGTGKTTLLRAAQSVWGRSTGICQMDDTRNAVVRKLGILHSITGYWDEIRGTSEEIDLHIQNAFRIGQGSEKARLQSTTAFQPVATWRLLLVHASNISLLDRAARIQGGTDAGAARLLEMKLEPLPAATIRGSDMLTLETNYGVAGEAFVLWLLTKGEAQIAQVVDACEEQMVAAIGSDPVLRMVRSTGAVLLAGALLATAAGVLYIDHARVFQAVLDATDRLTSVAMRARAASGAEALLRDYLQSQLPRTLKIAGGSGNLLPTVVHQPASSAEITVEYTIDTDTVVIVQRAFEQWLIRSHFDCDRKIEELVKRGAIKTTRRLGDGTQFAGPSVPCLVVKGKQLGYT